MGQAASARPSPTGFMKSLYAHLILFTLYLFISLPPDTLPARQQPIWVIPLLDLQKPIIVAPKEGLLPIFLEDIRFVHVPRDGQCLVPIYRIDSRPTSRCYGS